MRNKVRGQSDVIIGAGLLALCAFMAWRTSLMRPVGASSGAGPTLIPWIMIGGIALLSIWLIIRALRGGPRTGDKESAQGLSYGTIARLSCLAVLLVGYAIAFTAIGYLASTLLIFVAALALFGERRPLVLLLVPGIVTGAIYWGFTQLLNVWLP
ncbi:tripartite tricarboxylate transporter TctB family protein [Falsirhodobacter halotolerans]|uniref:tripartite tricarboxylate transporter TctB family protein n=1 Tax=Falsirhodobacter halotolerans TaxID=1146892 RepID=UPI001FD03FF0|nr:tripartite tricarboxylate transporter TctB family protein [Falsirhodobacter halotolerans]MCJ8141039.1 tripartite tricarboxylate transporter TctB family protein [Falsirhodobacter halotolerans]